MTNLIHILFLIFGWCFDKQGLLIASLSVSSVFMLVSLVCLAYKKKVSLILLLSQITVFTLSIIKLCIL